MSGESVQLPPTVVETPGQIARADAGWTVAPEPHLRIGLVDGPEPYLFSVIASVRQMPDGEILVTDRSGELRYFDREGSFLYRTGGQGQGPGEFTTPQVVPSGDDSLWVWDGRQRRLTAMSLDGRTEHRSVRIPSAVGIVEGVVGGQTVSRQSIPRTIVDITQTGALTQTQMNGIFSEPREVEVLLTSLSTIDLFRDSRRIAYFEDVATGFSFADPNSDLRILAAMPFRTPPSVAVGKDAFYVTRGEDGEIVEYGPVGDAPHRVFRLVEPPRTVTRAMYNAAVNERFPAGPAYMVDAHRAQPLPLTMAVFESLLVDELGWVWAEVYDWGPASPTTWVLFDLGGRARGTVETPEALRVRHIGETFILGTRRDALGVEYVERYALTRR